MRIVSENHIYIYICLKFRVSRMAIGVSATRSVCTQNDQCSILAGGKITFFLIKHWFSIRNSREET